MATVMPLQALLKDFSDTSVKGAVCALKYVNEVFHEKEN
jgi:hypothetical protein